MSSIIQTIQKRSFLSSNQALPLSQSQSQSQSHTQTTTTDSSSNEQQQQQSLIRRRLSSLSLNNLKRPAISSPASSSSWAFRRSKSVSSMGEYAGTSLRKWWDWGWNWILSRKPTFAKDLELNEQETSVLGFNNKGSWRHVFYKVRSELRKLVGSSHHNAGLPQTYKYDSFNYSKNFDDGHRSQH